MLSYAQNAEDVVLRRVFFDRAVGFYVDIGACDPVEDSVTKHFYDHGWQGVNVEPDARFHAALAAARSRDVNLCAAVGRGEAPVTFYPGTTRGHGTLDSQRAGNISTAEHQTVPQISLAWILEKYAPAEGVDFLKVDVEGWEAAVLASADWSRFRPRVVVVEAIDPDGSPSHERWEGPLLAAGYNFGLYDGVNRFYCRQEDADTLLPRLAAPGNVLDNWRLAREVRAQADAVAGCEAQVRHLSAALAAQNTMLIAQKANLVAESAAHAATRTALQAELAAHAATRHALKAEQATADARRQQLLNIQASTSWRITEPLRNAKKLVRLVKPGG
jgi:FkbM family methyltransferase